MSIGAPQIEIAPEWQSYLDLDNDIKPYLQIPSSSTSSDMLLQTYIDAACWWAQDYLNQPIAPTTFFRRFNGYTGFGGSAIALPYFPVLDVPTVVEYWGASGSRADQNCSITADSITVTDANCQSSDIGSYVTGTGIPNGASIVTVNAGENFTMNVAATLTINPVVLTVSNGHVLSLQTPQNQGNSDMYTLEATTGIIIRSYLGLLQRPSFPGLKNIEVTWTAGRSPVPAHWLMATRELVKYWWVNTQQASRELMLPGQRETEYDNPADRYSLWPAVPDRVAMMFSPAKQIGFA